MTVNRKELARRMAQKSQYNNSIAAQEESLILLEEIIIEALENNETIKLGKLLKIEQQLVPKKRAWDGLNRTYFIRPEKYVPKIKALSRITNIEKKKE